jgi:hypothetical protein
VRDRRKDSKYFSEYMAYIDSEIEECLEDMSIIETMKPTASVNMPWALFELLIERIELKYCLGESINSLTPDVQQGFDWLVEMDRRANQLELREDKVYFAQKRNLTLNNYYFYLYWLTFAKAVDLDQSLVKEAISIMAQVGVDRLFDLIMVQLGDKNRKIGEKVRHPKIFKKLLGVVEAPEVERPGLMKAYLDGWYASTVQEDLNDDHEDDDFSYRGYWCYEAALVVMLWNIDDSSFRNNPYYPKDLVRKL